MVFGFLLAAIDVRKSSLELRREGASDIGFGLKQDSQGTILVGLAMTPILAYATYYFFDDLELVRDYFIFMFSFLLVHLCVVVLEMLRKKLGSRKHTMGE
ncbi:MAG: hypothetical protein AAB343_01650 [Patescibacteria group bacterium]